MNFASVKIVSIFKFIYHITAIQYFIQIYKVLKIIQYFMKIIILLQSIISTPIIIYYVSKCITAD